MAAGNLQEAPKAKKKLGTGQIIALIFILLMTIAIIIGALQGFGR